MARSKLFAAVFILLAFLIAWWMVQHVPHPVTLHINDRWHIMLIGENNTTALQFKTHEFTISREDQRNLWLSGTGQIKWLEHKITVTESDIHLNNHIISTNIQHADINIMFYPDGRVTKGNLKLK